MVAIINYGLGNIESIKNAFNYIGEDVAIISSPKEVLSSDVLILPGVGSFSTGVDLLKSKGLDKAIHEAVASKGAKILGICLGMQLLGCFGEEGGGAEGLRLINQEILLFDKSSLGEKKIPHVGFNRVRFSESKGLFRGLGEEADFYFTHSYRMLKKNEIQRVGECDYGESFMAAFEEGSICGAQFHPEKSQSNGLIFLKNFLNL